MPEPFAEDELVTCNTSMEGTLLRTKQTYIFSLGRRMMRTSDNTGIHHTLDTCGERESGIFPIQTLAQKSVRGTDEKDHSEQEVVRYTKECNNSDAGTCICTKNSLFAGWYTYTPTIITTSIFWRSSCLYNWTAGDNDDVAGNEKHTTNQKSLACFQNLLDNKQKYSYNETKQKEREHPDDSGKITNQTYRLKISLAQKGEVLGGIKESKQPAEVPSDPYTYRTSITDSYEQGGRIRSDGTHSSISKRRSTDFMDEQMLGTNVKMKRNTWEIGRKTTYTKHKLLDLKGLFLLFTVLLIPEPTRGTNQHEVCGKHSKPSIEYHELLHDIKQEYLHMWQKLISKAIANISVALDILYMGNRSFGATKSNEVGYDTNLPDSVPMTADMGSSKRKKLANLDPLTSKMEKSEQEELNHSFKFLVLESCVGFMMILISTFIIWVERKKLKSMESEKSGHKDIDEKKELRRLNNIQATVQTENSKQDKLVSSLTGSMTSAKSTLVHTTDQCRSEKCIYSGNLSYGSLHEGVDTSPMSVKDLFFKEYPMSLKPDLPIALSISLTELDTSKCKYVESYPDTDYCGDNTCLKELSAGDEICRLEPFVFDTDDSTDTHPKRCLGKVSSDSKCTSFDNSDCTTSITSSYPIQSRSLSDRNTSVYTYSLSSNVPVNGHTGEMKDSPGKKCGAIFENVHVESRSEADKLSESEMKHAPQMFSEDSETSLDQQAMNGNMKQRDITEYEWMESELQESDYGHVDFADFEDSCVTDSEDDSETTVQKDKVDSCFNHVEKSFLSQSTTINAEHTSVVEHHSLMILEETENPQNARVNDDSQKLVENANFQKEQGNTYPECHEGNTYVENMKEKYHLKNMKDNTNAQADKENTNSGDELVRSQNFQENAKMVVEKDCRQNTKSENLKEDGNYLNVNVNPVQQSIEENDTVLNVQEKTDLQKVEESSNLQKVKVDVNSQNVKGTDNINVKKVCNCLIHKGSDGCPTNVNHATEANNDKSVAMKEKSFINVKRNVLHIDVSKTETNEVGNTRNEDTASFVGTTAEEDKSLIRMNEEGNLKGNGAQFTVINRMEEDVKQDINASFAEIVSTAEGTIEGYVIKDEIKGQENQSLNSDEAEGAILNSTISEDEGYLSGRKMDSKCYSQDKVQEKNEDLSWSKQNRERNSKRRDELKVILEMEAKTVKPTESSEIFCFVTAEYITDGDLRLIKDNIKAKIILSLDLDEAEKGLMSSSISKEKVFAEKCVNKDNEHFKQEEAKDVSNAILREENTTSNEVNRDHEKNILRGKDTFQANTTEKSEKIKEKCTYSPSCLGHTKVCDSPEHEFETKKEDVIDKQKPDSFAARDNVEDGHSQAQHSVEQNIGHTEPHVTEEKVKCEEKDPGFKMIKHGSGRGPNSQVGDPRKLREKMRNECYLKQNSSSGVWMEILSDHSVDCDLKSALHQRLDKSAGFQKKYKSQSRLKNIRMLDFNRENIDYVSYETDEESFSSLPNAAEYKTRDYSNAICKVHRKTWAKIAPYNDRDHSCIIRESGFQKSQQKNSFGVVRKLSQFLQNRDSLFKFSRISQQNSNLDKDERVKSAIRKCRLRQNLRPELDELGSIGESIDSGLGTIESYRSDVILELETLEHAFHDNKVKLSSKKLRKLKRNLRKKESKIKKELSAGYINAVFNPRYFRPELSSVIVYPGLQRYFQRLDEGPLSREESLSFEWLRLESLRNYDGAGSIIQLARGGFYHDPVDGPLSTRCYACNVLYTNWEYFDNVIEVHRRLSPNCPHLRENASGNVSIDNGPTNNLPNRTGSSVTVESPEDRASEHDSQSATAVSSITDSLRATQIRDVVAEGFPQQPTEDRLNTEYNRSSPSLSATGPGLNLAIGQRTERNTLNQSGSTENGRDVNNTATSVTSGNRPDVRNQPNQARQPNVTTTVSSPVFTGASKIRERNQGNGGFAQNTASLAQTSQQAETVVQALNNPHLVHVTNPKYSEYATIDSRARSFTSMWPSYLDQTPQQMADAGFFYAGVADFTRCFACGGGLRNWEAGDDPCLEHTRWYPRCEYMNKLKGSRYVEAVTRRQEEHLAEQRRRNAEQQAQRRQAATNVSQDPMATPAAQTLLEMGYSRERTKEAILAVRRNTGHNFVSAEQALIWILDRDEEEDEQPPAVTTAVTTTTTGNSTSTTQSTATTGTTQSTATTSSSSSQSSNESSSSSGYSSSASSGVTGQGQGRKGQGRSQSSPSGREKLGTPTSDDKNTVAEDEGSEQKGANGNGSQAQGRQKKKGKKKGKGGANGKGGGYIGLRGGANKEEEVVAASLPTAIDTESLKAENEKLKEMQTCKICMDNPVNVTLLPCGHLVCCESCAPHLRKCPICRRRIDGSIKTFMS